MLSSAAMGMGGYPQQQQQQQQPRGAAVFTAAQWAELEHQALIYKYLMAGVPVPPDLLLPIRPHSAFSFSPAAGAASSFYHHHHPSLSYYAYYGKKLDPEPWRCRRTDGKKWRCSKEAHPDSKYCERHMHRGRNRSRKPVESSKPASSPPARHQQSTQLSTVTSAATRETEPLAVVAVGARTHGLSLGGAGSSQLHVDASSYGSKFSLGAKADVGELSFLSGSNSSSSRAFTIDSPSDGSWHSVPPPSGHRSYRTAAPQEAVYNYPPSLETPRELGQAVTIASLSQEQERRCRRSFNGGAVGGRLQENQPLRPFLDEWPATSRDPWSEMDDARTSSFSTTQLSISIPRCD